MTSRTCSYRDPQLQPRCTECGNTLTLCQCLAPDDAAHYRLVSDPGSFIRSVWDALEKSDLSAEPNLHLLAKLNATIGDVNFKFLSHDEASRGGATIEPDTSADEIYHALIRAAMLALRLAIEGDPDYAFDPQSVGENI